MIPGFLKKAGLAARLGLVAFCPIVPIAHLMGQEQAPSSSAAPVAIQVNLSNAVGRYKPIYAWFGYDEANYTTTPHGTELLRQLHDLSSAPVYIRAHNLLTSGNGVAELKVSSTNVYGEDPSGKPVYDFKLLDGIFDAYKAAGVRPMVELGFMPKDLAATLPGQNKPYQVHYPHNVTSGLSNNPPKDYGKWEELVRVVTAHLVTRYGRDEVLTWYFEVWNEPDIGYWHGTREDYWKLYDYAVAGVRKALPGAKVGGPASTGPGNEKAYSFLKGFLEHVNSGKSAANGQQIPIDFISFHAKGHPAIIGGKVTMGIDKELTDADRGFQLISSFPRFKRLPIILSEADPDGCAACSAKLHPANNYRNGTLYPAYTAVVLKGLSELQDHYAVNLISMLSWSFEFENADYFEGYRSLATNGIDKPILNVFRMFGLMAGTRVQTRSSGRVPLDTLMEKGVRGASDVDAFATRAEHESAVLVWNYKDVKDAAKPVSVNVAITGLPPGVHKVLVQQYRIDDEHSNSYTAWLAMGSPQHPTAQQYAKLQRAGQLHLLTSPEWVDASRGQLKLDTELPGQSISLFRLQW